MSAQIPEPPNSPVRICGSCGHQWPVWRDFLHDPRVRILGIQVVPNMPEANLLVFEHSCGSSISVLATKLRHLLETKVPPLHAPCLYGTEACGQECRRIENLNHCNRHCRNSGDRQLAILINSVKQGRAVLA